MIEPSKLKIENTELRLYLENAIALLEQVAETTAVKKDCIDNVLFGDIDIYLNEATQFLGIERAD